jgi:hypothetical protein
VHLPPEVLAVLPPGTRLRVHPRPDGTVLLAAAQAGASAAAHTGGPAGTYAVAVADPAGEYEPADDAAGYARHAAPVPDYSREVA